MRISPQSHILYQTSLLQKELREAFSRCTQGGIAGLDGNVLANARVVEAYKIQTGLVEVAKEEEQEEDLDDDCAICFEDILKGGKEELVSCFQCRKKLHKDCFTRWRMTKAKSHEKVTCVYCRVDWFDMQEGTPGKVKGVMFQEGGYVNLAALQGISTTRDESSYADFYRNRHAYRGSGRWHFDLVDDDE